MTVCGTTRKSASPIERHLPISNKFNCFLFQVLIFRRLHKHKGLVIMSSNKRQYFLCIYGKQRTTVFVNDLTKNVNISWAIGRAKN